MSDPASSSTNIMNNIQSGDTDMVDESRDQLGALPSDLSGGDGPGTVSNANNNIATNAMAAINNGSGPGGSSGSTSKGPGGNNGNGRNNDISLDLSFGDTPMEFQKVNFLGSRLQNAAIYSLVLSVNTITYLDLRGNSLDASFGWRLIKSMKKKYLQLEYCNGVSLKGLKDNTQKVLDLCSFKGHDGMYGIEVVGAIFLAHFLRLNTSLRKLFFRRNDVEKEGAKALAQAMIGNNNCQVSTVNTMGIDKQQGKTGIDFRSFRNNSLTNVSLPMRNLDDDDIVFLEEWLLRHDCTTSLDVSRNPFVAEGVRKLHRYVINTTQLQTLVMEGVSLDLEGVSLMSKALQQNTTLVSCNFSTRAAWGISKDKQIVIHALSVALAKHPTLKLFGATPLRVGVLKDGNMEELRENRIFASQHKSEIALYFWLLAVLMPQGKTDFSFGSVEGTFPNEFPQVKPFNIGFCPPLNNALHECRDILQTINLAIPKQLDGLAVQILRHLRTSSSLKSLKLPGYASCGISEIPPDWASDGVLPSWTKERLGSRRPHWQVINSFLSECKSLTKFNDIDLTFYEKDSAERALLLLLQCTPAVHCVLSPGGSGDDGSTSTSVALSFTSNNDGLKSLDVSFVLSMFRLVDRLIYEIDLHFCDPTLRLHNRMSGFLKVQESIADYFLNNESNSSIPPFVHNLRIRSADTHPKLIAYAGRAPLIREFGVERIEKHLDTLIQIFTSPQSKQEIERIRIDRKWLQARRVTKYYSIKQREQLLLLQKAWTESPKVIDKFEILTSSEGEITKEDMKGLTITEFGDKLAGIVTDSRIEPTAVEAQAFIPAVVNPRHYFFPDPSDDSQGEPKFLKLPIWGSGEGGDDENGELKVVSLCMVNLKQVVSKIRSDEYGSTSRVLWADPRCTINAGQYLDDSEVDGGMTESKIAAMEFDKDGYDLANVKRFHWSGGFKLGTEECVARCVAARNSNFEKEFLKYCLESLLTSSTILHLDLRGNGLDKEDCLHVIQLLERNNTLLTLNKIPVVVDQATSINHLDFSGYGIPLPPPKKANEDDDDEDNNADEGNMYCCQTFENEIVRLDEGDGYLFASLVTAANFPQLRSLRLADHSISDSTLAYICDCLLALPTLENLEFSNLKLTNRGANLLLSAVSEIAPNLRSVNGIPVRKLLQERKGAVTDQAEVTRGALLAGKILWNDFSMGLLSRLKLWPFGVWPPDDSEPFSMEGSTLTDVGVRGVCGLLKCFAGGDGVSVGRTLPRIQQLDFSRNPQLTDAAVAVLCKALTNQNSLNSLEKLTMRYCPRLRARSALELSMLVRTKVLNQGEGGLTVRRILNQGEGGLTVRIVRKRI